jgi:hypothetical protein
VGHKGPSHRIGVYRNNFWNVAHNQVRDQRYQPHRAVEQGTLRLFEKRGFRHNRCPKLANLLARPANISETNGVVWSRPDSFAKTDIANET